MAKRQFNFDLIDDLARGRAIIFIGAGASMWAKPLDGTKFKNWKEFLIETTKKVEPKARKQIKAAIANNDLLIACELIKSHLSSQWDEIINQEFSKGANTSKLHKAIIRLQQRIIATTNFDKLIENAWNESKPSIYPSILTNIEHESFKVFRDNNPYVIKIHGSVDLPQQVVLDKTSFQKAAFSNSLYRDFIGTLLLTHTFLFIGFSMTDPAISQLVESHAFRFPSTRPHYAFTSGENQPDLDELSKRLRKIFPIRYSEKNDHIELAKLIEQLGAQTDARRRELTAASI